MRILVTGANGFVGRGVVSSLSSRGYSVCSLVRKTSVQVSGSDDYLVADLCSKNADYHKGLSGVDTVVHLAARTQISMSEELDPMRAFREVNVEATRNLAIAAAERGVRRFIFMSSVKVNGETTGSVGRPEVFSADSIPNPEDFYGVSKLEAESALQAIARDTGLEIVILRPPLVYGPGVGGNFLKLMRLVASGLPLPFGALHNRRSLVSLANLTDLIFTCITHPAATNKIIMAADGEDLSTTQLLQRLAKAMTKSIKLIPVPESMLKLGFILTGQRPLAQRLCGSLQVNISNTRKLLAWEPALSVDEGLNRAVESFVLDKVI